MGCCFSCRSSAELNSIRVVHLNGYVEDFESPVTVSQITGKSSEHFICTALQLLTTGTKPLDPQTQLQPGQIYYLFPYSTLTAEASPMDFAAIVKRLNSIAKSSSCQANNKSSRTMPILNSPATSPNRFMDPQAANWIRKSNGGRTWKPILDTIREKSFNRRSESEVLQQEMQLENSELK
ncbi:uncharacterized protein LOC110617364 [Manihot esculenta]|uniref:DUF4228 domain-containing protein n=1 Tax=Manihot esculenta TaxID=3983 RepID=A0A2C9VPL2_MANES|nr:uncharacterized protein LOC110617364 [Manihot esculenta]OAY46707.1 hypothetical protein MANES_06G020600v8 [Manihot esculenta]